MPVASSLIIYFIAVTYAGAGVARITEQWRWNQVNGLEMLTSRNQMASRRVVFAGDQNSQSLWLFRSRM